MSLAPANDKLILPTVYRPVALRELADAYAEAVKAAPEAGAGALYWVRRFDLVEAAVVLEPAEPLAAARRSLFAAMNAAADALASYCPPEKPITFTWPDSILFDGGLLGGVRIGWPEHAKDTDVPDWLVVGLMLRSVVHARVRTDGATPHVGTSLEDEGFEMMEGRELIASFARHLMVHLDRWQTNGFNEVGKDYLARLAPEKGTRRGLDANGDLLVHRTLAKAPAERRALAPALQACAWRDPETGEPWL